MIVLNILIHLPGLSLYAITEHKVLDLSESFTHITNGPDRIDLLTIQAGDRYFIKLFFKVFKIHVHLPGQ